MSIIWQNVPGRKDLLHIKPARTAGTSINKFLFYVALENKLIIKNQNVDYPGEPFHNSRIIENRTLNRGVLSTSTLNIPASPARLCNQFDIVMSVRNPWDRFISSLAYYARSTNYRRNSISGTVVNGKEIKSFEDFLDKDGKLSEQTIDSLFKMMPPTAKKQNRSHLFRHIFENQVELINGIDNPIHLIRYENLEEDLSRFLKMMGLSFDISNLSIENRFGYAVDRDRSPKGYRNYYNTKSMRLIEKIFKNDISYLQYSF